MSDDLDRIFDECLDRLNNGESVEECLKLYPDHVDELEPLLVMTDGLYALTAALPRDTVKSQGKASLQQMIRERRQEYSEKTLFARLFAVPKIWVPAAIALSVVLVALVLTLIPSPSGDTSNVIGAPNETESPPVILAASGMLEVRVHDAPPEYDIQEVWITFDSLEVHPSISEQDMEKPHSEISDFRTETPAASGISGSAPGDNEDTDAQISTNKDDSQNSTWLSLAISDVNTFNILEFQGGLEGLLSAQELTSGRYTQIRISVSKIEVNYFAEDSAELNSAEARIPSGKLKFTKPFEILPGRTTILSFDFVIDKSIVITGKSDIIFKPVIKLDVSYQENEASTELIDVSNSEIGGKDTEDSSGGNNGKEKSKS